MTVAVIHWTSDPSQLNITYLSLVTSERSSEGVLDTSTLTSSGEVLDDHRNQCERTRGTVRKAERFQDVRTPRHQIHYRRDIAWFVIRHRDVGEVETTWEVAQSTRNGANTPAYPEGPGECGRGQGRVPSVDVILHGKNDQLQILEKGERAHEVESL